MVRALALSFVFLFAFIAGAVAQTCAISYSVRPGDSLSVIAERHYSNAFVWTELYTANLQVIGQDPDRILVGTALILPCLAANTGDGTVVEGAGDIAGAGPDPDTPAGPDDHGQPATAPLVVAQVVHLPPFADQRSATGGLITELMRAATRSGFPLRDAIFTGPDQADPELLSDLMFPVIPPACPGPGEDTLCEDFLYSDPLFEMLMMFFVRADAPLPLVTDDDLRGKRLCRPAGLPVYMLDAGGRDWLSRGLLTVVRATDPEGCFAMLQAGGVDAVLLNEFTGRAALSASGREDDIIPLDKSPAGIVTLSVAVPRAAPEAGAVMDNFNDGLRDIRSTGAFQEVLDRHMANVWAGL